MNLRRSAGQPRPLRSVSPLNRILTLHLFIRVSQSAIAFALAYWVFTTTQSATLSAVALFARLGPSILLSLYAGWLTDVRSPARLYLAALAAQCAISALLAAVLFLAGARVGPILALIAAASVVDSFLSAAFQRLALSAVASDDPDKTLLTGRISLVDSLPPLIGPSLGVLALASVQLPGLFAIDAAVALSMLLLAPQVVHPLDREEQRPPPVPLLHGVRAIVADPVLRALQLLFSSQNLLNGAGAGLLAAFVLGTAGAGKAQYATIVTAMAVGAVIGSIVASLVAIPGRWRMAALVGSAVFGAVAGRAIPGLLPTVVAVAAGLTVRALLGPIGNAVNQAMWLDRIDRTRQGVIFGARRLLSQGPYPVGILLAAGVAAPAVSPSQAQVATVAAAPDPLPAIFVGIGLLEASVAFASGVAVWRTSATSAADATKGPA